MSDYGSRSYGSGSEEYGWGGESRSRGFGDSYGDYSDYAPRQRDSGYGATAPVDPYSVRTPSPHDEPVTSGRARVPGADGTGPGRARGSARVGGARRRGAKSSEEESDDVKKARKKKKRRRKLIALSCVLVMLMGIGTVVGTVFFESVPLPDEVDDALHRNTTITYANGDKMGKIGTEFGNRTYVNVREDGKAKKPNDVPENVTQALLAMEDRGFYEHDGVDFWGVMRALVNNVTGGDTQGASTLTQQYVGQAAKIRGEDSYLRKAREAVMAMKMDDEYEKHEIIEHYLNLVYMGRGAYGLGAAVKAWYGEDKKVKDLTASEAAVIFAQVKNPDSIYDPNNGKEAEKAAKGRWKYALDGMVEQGWMKDSERDKLVKDGFPDNITDTEAMSASEGKDTPTGFVSHDRVLDEAKERYGLTAREVRSEGLTITTTINKDLQKIAKKVADKKSGTAMSDEQENLRAALVAIDPKTGGVLAYYGGSNSGANHDKAYAVHPPGSSFKEVTVSAAIADGYGPDSRWNGKSPREFDERGEAGPVHNSGEGDGRSEENISLAKATELSLNTPMYAIATKIGANTIVKLAEKMGVERMQVKDENGEPVTRELESDKVQDLLKDDNPRKFVDNEVSFGQFPVSVVDMAAVNATLAAQGVHRETHYIKKITDANGDEVAPISEVESDVALDADDANNVTDILTKVHPTYLGGNKLPSNSQTFAGKSGTWERSCGDGCEENSSISFGGYVPEIAAAAWVGDKDKENGTVLDAQGANAFGAGISGEVWGHFMNEAVQQKGFNSEKTFTPGTGTGTKPGEVGPKDDEGDDDDGEGGGDNPSCDPNNPTCDDGQPSCDPNEPTCDDDGSPSCDPNNPLCEREGDGAERIRPNYYGADGNTVPQNQYAVREDYDGAHR